MISLSGRPCAIASRLIQLLGASFVSGVGTPCRSTAPALDFCSEALIGIAASGDEAALRPDADLSGELRDGGPEARLRADRLLQLLARPLVP